VREALDHVLDKQSEPTRVYLARYWVFRHGSHVYRKRNVIFGSDKSSAEMTKEIQEALPRMFKLDSELIRTFVLSCDQLEKVIEQAPKGFGTEPGKYTQTPFS
jgi:hypothetical protein